MGSSLQRMVLLSPGDRLGGEKQTWRQMFFKSTFCSDYSTWDKPEELAHMTLDSPGVETRNPVSHHNVIRHPSAEDKARGPPRARSKYRQNNLFQPHHNQQAKE